MPTTRVEPPAMAATTPDRVKLNSTLDVDATDEEDVDTAT
jgi:hypothetical protein